MKRLYTLLIPYVFLLHFSCEKVQEEPQNEGYLIGKWNSKDIAYSILFNYEQGFELLPNGTYYSRYMDREDKSFYTDQMYFGKWYVDSKSKHIFFLKEYAHRTDTMKFEFHKISEKEIEIVDAINADRSYLLLKEI